MEALVGFVEATYDEMCSNLPKMSKRTQLGSILDI
jgi:hypothetical protein